MLLFRVIHKYESTSSYSHSQLDYDSYPNMSVDLRGSKVFQSWLVSGDGGSLKPCTSSKTTEELGTDIFHVSKRAQLVTQRLPCIFMMHRQYLQSRSLSLPIYLSPNKVINKTKTVMVTTVAAPAKQIDLNFRLLEIWCGRRKRGRESSRMVSLDGRISLPYLRLVALLLSDEASSPETAEYVF